MKNVCLPGGVGVSMKFKNLSRVERNMLTGLFCQFVTIL